MLIDSPVANPRYFPNDLSGLWEAVNVPLDVYSVHYTDNFTLFVSDNISHIHDNWAPPGGWLPGPGVAESQTFYEALFDAWRAPDGMLRMHEIDFLVFVTFQTPAFQADPEGARWWLEGMAAAAAARGVTIQYCSATALDAMQALRFPAVTNIRASTDYQCFVNYRVGPGYLISWALGLRPSKDVWWSSPVQPTLTSGAGCGGNFKVAQHYTSELDAVLALFSTGPVGFGDALNYTNATRVKATATASGLLLQPDKAATPLDWTLFDDLAANIQFANCAAGDFPCSPQLLQSHTALVSAAGDALQFQHIIAVAVNAHPLTTADIWPPLPDASGAGWTYVSLRRDTLGDACVDGGPAFAPNGCASKLDCSPSAAGLCLPLIDTGLGFVDAPNLNLAWAIYLLAPRAPSGWALLGELSKYNPISGVRIVAQGGVDFLQQGGLRVSVLGTPGEQVILSAIAPNETVAVRGVVVGAEGQAVVAFD